MKRAGLLMAVTLLALASVRPTAATCAGGDKPTYPTAAAVPSLRAQARTGKAAAQEQLGLAYLAGRCPGSKATDDYSVNPETEDVMDPSGEVVGNLGDNHSK